MPRINKDMSGAMVKAALKHSFAAAGNAIVARRARWMERLYEKIVPAVTLDAIEALPPGFVYKSPYIRFKVGASEEDVSFNGWAGQWGGASEIWKVSDKPEHTVSHFVKIDWEKRGHAATIDVSDPLFAEWEAIDNDYNTLCEKIATARAATTAAIGACHTVKQLIKAWPEFEPFAKPYDLPDNRQLPVVQTKRLNDMLDLPVEERNELLKIAEAVA